MTVKECYEHALSLIPEEPKENPDAQKFSVTWCNILLAETFDHENMLLKSKKLPMLKKIPKIETENESIPYDENFVQKVFPYGMARFLFRENDDISASHEFYRLYINALYEAVPVLENEITDIYI